MATATETLRAMLSVTEFSLLETLANSSTEVSGRQLADWLKVSPTTANGALGKLATAGFVSSRRNGRANLWRLESANSAVRDWLAEMREADGSKPDGESPYSTGGGGTRLEHAYAALIVASMLAGESVPELGDDVAIDSVRLQASDVSDVDDLLLVGRDGQGLRRASVAVRRNPALVTSDEASIPLFRDFLRLVLTNWSEVSSGRWSLVLAVSSNANAIGQLAELAELASSLPDGQALGERLAQPGRTNGELRSRFGHIKNLVAFAAEGEEVPLGLEMEELTWRVLHRLKIRNLRLERTDRSDRTAGVNRLQRLLRGGTPAAADALMSRIQEQMGSWAPQGAVLTQSVVRRAISDFELEGSPRYGGQWQLLERWGQRLRESVRPALETPSQTLELDRAEARMALASTIRSAGETGTAVVVTGDPDVGKSAMSLRVLESLAAEGATVTRLSLRDLPPTVLDLEAVLGSEPLEDVLGAGAAGPTRLLLIDGAEAVLQGRAPVLRHVATAALTSGYGLVAVTRTDGSRQVSSELASASQASGVATPPVEHMVGPLIAEEREALPTTFDSLARLAGDARTSWLLGRPGLVDVLLRTGAQLEPSALLCEADVFSTVWQELIRHHEEHEPGKASPEDREQSALNAARRELGLPTVPLSGPASAELRSDGVLRVPENFAFATGDEFATDLFRDFAVCRLLLMHGWGLLAQAKAPRWSIRAARLACQAFLIQQDSAAAWASLTTSLDALANTEGDRWREIPFEALLTLGHGEGALRSLWPSLTSNQAIDFDTLVRLADARFVAGTVGDPFALAPIISVAFCDPPSGLSASVPHHWGRTTPLEDLVLAWLRGMATSRTQPDPLRQQVRNKILNGEPSGRDDFAVEAIATLGPDLDDRGVQWLREVATQRPSDLDHAIESFAVANSMAVARPELLLELAEAYYIEAPEPESPYGGRSLLDRGIRDLRHGLGFGAPQAAWYYGPFSRLLNAAPVETVAFINRMLDHAARIRVTEGPSQATAVDDEPEGVTLQLHKQPSRRYVGDTHVWAWYRGTSVGPYPCMSALLALERFCDHLLEQLRIPASVIADMLLRECHNLAILGLLTGFLTRHPDSAGGLMDPLLASPDIWHLESARVAGDHGFRVRDADADKLTGSDRRRFTFHDTVGGMVVNARIAGDDQRLKALEQIGTQLLETAVARATAEGAEESDYLAVVESWAEEFRIENYRMGRQGEQVYIHFQRPERIELALAPKNAELQTTNTLYRLQNRYGRHNDDPASWPIASLAEDLSTARKIDASTEGPVDIPWPENALVAVAAAAVWAHGNGLARVDREDLRWAIDAVMWAAENPRLDGLSFYGTAFPMGADRAAAAATPLLLLAPFDSLDIDRKSVRRALKLLGTSVFDEVRATLSVGCQPVWRAQCQLDGRGKCIRHPAAWAAAIGGLRDARLGPWNKSGEREPQPLTSPLSKSLRSVAAEDLMLNRLRMPLACLVDARHVHCLQKEVSQLWQPLWDAHRRGLLHWWEEGYDHQGHLNHEPIAYRMVQIALEGRREEIASHIKDFATSPNAMHLLFDAFATVFTYDEGLRLRMDQFWPWAFEEALDALDERPEDRSGRSWSDYLAASLLPTPKPRSWDSDIDQTLDVSRRTWLQPTSLEGLAMRWVKLAHKEAKAVDAVIAFAKSTDRAWQTSTAFDWIEFIIDGDFEVAANRLWFLEEWLTELRSGGFLGGVARSQYHRIVDGLAAAGDRAAVRLQLLDE
jgi:hypothetical protein